MKTVCEKHKFFSWDLQYEIFEAICNAQLTGKLPGKGNGTEAANEFNSLYKYLMDSINPCWVFIGDINDPSKPVFKDVNGEEIYFRIYDVLVKRPNWVLTSTLLIGTTRSMSDTIWEGLENKCYYAFSKDTTLLRYYYDNENDTVSEVSKSHIPASILYYGCFKPYPIKTEFLCFNYRMIRLDALITDLVTKVSPDKTYIDYELKPYEDGEPFFKLSTTGYVKLDSKGIQIAINDKDHNLITLIMAKSFVKGAGLHHGDASSIIIPWGELSYKVTGNIVSFNFDCHNKVNASSHVFDSGDVIRGINEFITHEYKLRMTQQDIPLQNNFITFANLSGY